MNDQLLPCPFCGGAGNCDTHHVSGGYGEYAKTSIYHVVECQKCGAKGREYRQQNLIEFTTYTVQDFRNNPVLRAKVEDEYEAYVKQTTDLAIAAWNQRTK